MEDDLIYLLLLYQQLLQQNYLLISRITRLRSRSLQHNYIYQCILCLQKNILICFLWRSWLSPDFW